MTEAQILLRKIDTTKYKSPLDKKIKVSTIKALENFAVYLNNLTSKHVKKDKSADLEYTIGALFKDARKIKEGIDWNNYAKNNLSFANKCFQELVEFIKSKEPKHSANAIRKYSEIIRDYIFDLKYFVEYFEQKKNPSYVMFTGGKSYNNHSYELNLISNNLYWNACYSQNIFDQKMALNVSNFTLRQSLEIKFKRILGIYDVYNKAFNGPKLKHEFFADFISNNSTSFELPYSNLTFLLKVYKWTNITIHNAENPLIWQLKLALDYVNPFFNWGEGLNKDGKKVSSIFGAVKITDYDTLKQKLAQELGDSANEIVCIEFIKPEVIEK